MKIQKRIMLSNAWILTLALLLLLGISSILFNILRTEGNSQNSIYGNEKVFEVEQCLLGFNGDDVTELENILKEENCQFLIYMDEEQISTNINADTDLEKEIRKINLSAKPNLSYIDPNVVIGSKVTINGNVYDTYIVMQVYSKDHTIGEVGNIMFRFVVVGLLAATIILLFSLLFTKKMTKRIMEPVNKLLDSAHRVEQGDLSTPIEYSGEEEFETLCGAFNHMQEHLKLEQDKNAVYERTRTDMVAGISHDLRTPLTSIKGYVKGILDGVAAKPEKQKAYLEIVYNKAISMEKLLQKLFLFSKLETGNLPFYFVETDMNDFLSKYVKEEMAELEQRGVRLEFVVSKEIEYPVNIDTEQMIRVIANLVENAVKYAGNATLKIQIGLERTKESVNITIKDNGIGVRKDKIAHIFEQFYRADEARGTKGKEGNGLGLYIVKYIVEAHDGTITAENDKGLKIIIKLPLNSEKQ